MYCKLDGVYGLYGAIEDEEVSLVAVDFILSSNYCFILSKLLSNFEGERLVYEAKRL
jgi:hypothetical protein